MDAGYSYSADIWSLGVMVCLAPTHLRSYLQLWDPMGGEKLFNPLDHSRDEYDQKLFNPLDHSRAEYDDQKHLAQITALLGPPPQELLARGRRTSLFYNANGKYFPSSRSRFQGLDLRPALGLVGLRDYRGAKRGIFETRTCHTSRVSSNVWTERID